MIRRDDSIPPEVSSFLLGVLTGEDPFLPRRLLVALKDVGDMIPAAAFRILLLFLLERQGILHEDAMGTCCSIALRVNGELKPVLKDWACSPETVLRQTAARCLMVKPMHLGLEDRPLLFILAHDWHHRVRQEIARGLRSPSSLPRDDVVNLLKEFSGDARLCVRRAALGACWALFDRSPEDALTVLTVLLGTLVEGLREAFIENLLSHMEAFLSLATEVLEKLDGFALLAPQDTLKVLDLVVREKDWIHPRLLALCVRTSESILKASAHPSGSAQKMISQLSRIDDHEVQCVARKALQAQR